MYIEILGSVGAFIILLAFVMLQFQKWHEDDLIYDGSNAIGGIMLFIYAVLLGSYPFMIINAVWTIVSVKDVIAYFRNGKRRKGKIGHKNKK